MLRQEVVERRRWVEEQRFLDLMGITNLIPGPNSTELVMHIGRERAGIKGLIGARAAFILPAASITLFFAWLYVIYGSTTEGEWLLRGIKPVVLAVVMQAIWNLGKTAVKTLPLTIVGALVFVLSLLGGNEILLLFGGALVAFLMQRILASGNRPSTSSFVTPFLMPGAFSLVLANTGAVPYTALRLFLTFLKIGSVLYGSGYVLVAFLQNDFVERLAWLSEKQLLDAVAVGQFTPGPVFTTATFVGYVVGGFPGAILAPLGIFLPAFIFVGIAHALIDRLMGLTWVRPLLSGPTKVFEHHTANDLGRLETVLLIGDDQELLRIRLDGINVAAVGLMAAVAIILARDAVGDAMTAVLFLAALALLIRYKVNSAILVAAGALIGLVWEFLL